MATTDFPPALRLADLILDGELAKFISERRAQAPPVSWDRIARDLSFATDRKVDVNGMTVQNWARTLDEAAA